MLTDSVTKLLDTTMKAREMFTPFQVDVWIEDELMYRLEHTARGGGSEMVVQFNKLFYVMKQKQIVSRLNDLGFKAVLIPATGLSTTNSMRVSWGH